jgi:hypothetical protein
MLSLVILAATAPALPHLSADNAVWVVSPTESDAVAAVIGRPQRHPQPNQPGKKRCAAGNDKNCRYVGEFHQSEVQNDLGQDWYKVCGSPPLLLPAPPKQAADHRLSAGGIVVFFGTPQHAPWLLELFPAMKDCVSQWEAHCVRSFPFVGNTTAIVATGNGDRGAIYAAYEVSHQLLGVSPWWWWTGREPKYQGRVPLQLPINITIGTPHYKYRAIFPNDEDLLGGYARDPLGQNVMGLETWSRLCEAALRIKANTIQAGTVSYPDESTIALAARRGLVITASHFNLLGSNTYRWPDELSVLPYQGWDWDHEPQSMAHMWRASIDAQKNYEVLWSVGLRGVTDASYAACGADKVKCAEAMNHVVGNMTKWIREAQGGEAPIIWYLFGGAAALLNAGLLRPPANVHFLTSDDYPHIGIIDDTADAALCGGVYYHAAWYSTYTSQLSEMVPPSTFYSQISSFSKQAKSTTVFVLNVSDLLPVLLAAELIMRHIFDPSFAATASSPAVAQSAALHWWSKREYTDGDEERATMVVGLLERYYQLVRVPEGKDWDPLSGHDQQGRPFTVGDVWVGNLSRALSWCAMNTLPDYALREGMPRSPPLCLAAEGFPHSSLPSIITRVQSSAVITPLLALARDTDAVAVLLETNRSSGAAFFRASVGLRHTMYAQLWSASAAVATAIASYLDLNSAASVRRACIIGNISTAVTAFDKIFAAQRAAEGARWRGLYAADKISDLHRTRQVVRQLQPVLLNLITQNENRASATATATSSTASGTASSRHVGSAAAANIAAANAASAVPTADLTLLPVPIDSGTSQYQFYQYQLQHQRSFPLLHNSSTWNLYRLVRVQCQRNGTGGSFCHTLPTGGVFGAKPNEGTSNGGKAHGGSGGAMVVMAAIDNDCPIRYNTDGTDLNDNSQEYLLPVFINETTVFKAALVCDGTEGGDLFVSTLTFTRA